MELAFAVSVAANNLVNNSSQDSESRLNKFAKLL
jgi:hypothetical protein